MSEYQYYEFRAIDRPLTTAEIKRLRSFSTRARITPTSFVNEYHFGDFKGDADEWMEKYFDAHLYYANWGTRILQLRLPSSLANRKAMEKYCIGERAEMRAVKGKVILTFINDSEAAEADDDFRLSAFAPLRTELCRGDYRSLYLSWLACLQAGEVPGDTLEPPVPRGLNRLSASDKRLVQFFEIDHKLLKVAGSKSEPLQPVKADSKELLAWVAKLPAAEKDRLLSKIVLTGSAGPANELLMRHLCEVSSRQPRSDDKKERRTAGELMRESGLD